MLLLHFKLAFIRHWAEEKDEEEEEEEEKVRKWPICWTAILNSPPIAQCTEVDGAFGSRH